MNVDMLTNTLGWCAVINMVLLAWWLLFITLAHDWTWQFHRRWFQLSREQFDAIHYTAMAFYKICIFLFNIVPWVALKIVM